MGLAAWRERVRFLKREISALYLAAKDPRVPWYAKVLAACVVAYAFSPIDLIPDPIPVLGYLDDLVLLPLGIALVLRLVPAEVLDDCRRRAESGRTRPVSWTAAAVIVAVWIAVAVAGGYVIVRWLGW
jgi:uncharacterized membrane protein YkvA (DUF1232 family)